MSALLSPTRLMTAAVVLSLAVQPSLLPHPWPILSAVAGAAALNGYALATFVEWLLARVPGWTPARPRLVWTLAAIALPLIAALAAVPGSRAVAVDTGMPVAGWWTMPLAVLGADLILVAGVLLFTGITRLVTLLARLAPPVRLSAAVVAPLLLVSAFLSPAHDAPIAAGLGAHGQDFLAGATRVPGGTAPVRVYVPKGGTPSERAAVAVDGLAARGGFDRRYVLVALPTGSGWVNQEAVSGLERTTRGDVATVAVQYASVPSWLAYVQGGEGAQASARAVLDAVRARIATLPAGHRPKLLAYGESLGAWAGEHAYPGVPPVDGALWVGLPGSGVTHAQVRGRTVTMANTDDPVPFWSPRLLVHPEPGLPGRWLPVTTFWQVTADTIAATTTPAGHGHRYGSLDADWRVLTSQ